MNFQFMVRMLPAMGPAIRNALMMAFFSIVVGWILGILIALVRVHKVKVLSQICAVYVSFMRSVPLIVLMFFAYYAIPTLIAYYCVTRGLPVNVKNINKFIYPLSAMSLSEAAFASETFRSAIQSVNVGQMEAASSIGMTRRQAYFRIIFPQAFVVAIPNLGGQFVNQIKGTTLAYYTGVTEITGKAYELANPSYMFLEAFFLIAVLYEVLSFIFSKFFRWWESRIAVYKSGSVPQTSHS